MTRYQFASVAAVVGTSAAMTALTELAAIQEGTAARRWFRWGDRMLFDLGDADSWADERAIDRLGRGIPG